MAPPRQTLLDRLSLRERTFILEALRQETVGGALLLLGAVLALAWANSPWGGAYQAVREFSFGPEALHLHLTVQQWASDGLLAIFFFVAGLELKRELVVGELRDPAKAALPVAAAVAGMILPAVVYVLVAWGEPGALRGWAVPTATDIAFALAVLAVIGRYLPAALRAFLLTLAVVDDLGAILIIAVFFSHSPNLPALLGALALVTVYYALQRLRVRGWWLYVPLAVAVWALTHASGVHATVAGVALGLVTRVLPDPGEERSPAERVEHHVRPISAGFAVPVFALASAGVSVSGESLAAMVGDRAALGVVAGLFVGKALGVFGGTYLTARFTRATLAEGLAWNDVFAVSVLAGIGFTVSLLMGELAFAADPDRMERVKAAVLTGSLLSSLVAAVLLRLRDRVYRRIYEEETRDSDRDGVPDVYQAESGEKPC
ncbi:Na(+)/H(+) antiporter NhaA [Carbonactinospora thermoautotrophica]|uniref:Na(+)/H(+) antiporter NhaA n=1 Tax=Carbonactinospora thermoautotrophica TaxID=1469144 RepID=A0A132MM23_9ACTN|nr:Na+/H+ antiporter NhaA [Carbonactinospora thermoautotrophica]KWW98775.1 Na(+)/H(+) antiporter NhaA [Carbonactinospora thermoautotrophica]